MLGRDDDDPLFLQAKEAQASVLEPYLGKGAYANHGRRVVEGQRLMQGASDILLGWLREKGDGGVARDFYVRQLWDQKGSATVEAMSAPELEATPGSAAGRSQRPMPGRATRSRSRATSARATSSTRPSLPSRKPTPTRTNATTPPSYKPSTPAG